jgi:hypothetical protein
MSTFQTLRQLHAIIGTALSDIETNFRANGLADWPSLDEPFTPGAAESATAQCVEATNLIVAAAEQMSATVRGPFFTLFDASMAVRFPLFHG